MILFTYTNSHIILHCCAKSEYLSVRPSDCYIWTHLWLQSQRHSHGAGNMASTVCMHSLITRQWQLGSTVQVFLIIEILGKVAMFVRFILLLTSRLKCTNASRHSVYLIFFAASNKGKGGITLSARRPHVTDFFRSTSHYLFSVSGDLISGDFSLQKSS